YVGDGTGGMYELVSNPLGPQPDFDLAVDRLVGNVVAGSVATFSASVVPKNGFDQTVTLTATAVPHGATGTLTPSTVGPAAPAGGEPYSSRFAISTSTAGPL